MPADPPTRAGSSPPFWLLALLPLLLGLAFQASGSGNGDSPAYRSQVCLLETLGHLDLPRLEWSHPGHIATVWALHRPLAALGLWQDPHFTIQLLAFALLGLTAWVVARTFAAETGRSWIAFFAGLCLALLPGWNWHAQDSLSDVSGQALVILTLCTLRWLRLRGLAGLPTALPAALAGLCAALSFLFRPGAGLFLPIYLWFTLEALIPLGRRWLPAAAWILGVGLIPLLLVYGEWLTVYGVSGIEERHLIPSGDNIGTADHFGRAWNLIVTWAHHCHRGLGSFALLMAVMGWWLWLWRGSLGEPVRSWRRLRLPALVLVGLLPYCVFLLSNRTADQFRFTLPMQAVLVLGIPALAAMLGRLGSLRPAQVLAACFVLATTLQLSLWLPLFAGRDAFVERAAQEVIAAGRAGDILLGNQCAPYLEFRSRFQDLLAGGWGRPTSIAPRHEVLPVRYLPWERDADFWNHGWRSVEKRLLLGRSEGKRILLANEFGMSAFRAWLPMRGFGERVLAEVPADLLRNRLDNELARMDPTLACNDEDLHVIELVPPELDLRREEHELVVLAGPRRAGMEVRVHGGIYDEGHPVEIGGCPLPFHAASEHGLSPIAQGFVDEQGVCRLRVDNPPETVVALLFRTPDAPLAVGRSQVLCLVPDHDRSDPSLALFRMAIGQ